MSLSRGVALVRARQQLFTPVRHSSDYGTQVGFKDHRQKFMKSFAHAKDATATWRLASFACAPILVAVTLMVYFKHEQEHKNPRPEYVPYEYMYYRTKNFPWGGNKTLFHNPAYNPVPGVGYEVEDPAAHH